LTSSPISRWFRSIEAAAVAGLAFAVLSFIALLLLTSSPDPSVPDSEMTSWYADSANRTSLTIGLSLSIVAAISFLWFVAVIRRRVGDREDRFFATVFLGSGILLTGVMLVGAAALASAAITVDLADGRVPDASVLAAFNGFGTTLLLVVLLRVQAVFVATTSTLALRTSAFNRWLSYLGYGIALAIFVMPMVSEPVGLAFPVWVGILSIALLVRRTNILPSDDRS
jgi:multidrug transporter EmrE-like cation transporter